MMWLYMIVFIAALYLLICLLYVLFQERFILHPQKLPKQYPFKSETELEELDLATKDYVSISAVMLNPHGSRGVVVYYHGNMYNLKNYIPYTKKFWEQDYAVLMMDYRGFGKSTGKLTEKNYYNDALIAYDYAAAIYPAEKIIIYGRSMGTAAASYVASVKNCGHLILEAPFYNLYDLSRRLWMLLPSGNYLKFSFRNDAHLQNIKAPVTIIHGTKDRTVPIKSAEKLKTHLKTGDQFITIEGGKHNNLDQFDLYHERLNEILQ